jgi:SAM-dependent methyltransferase
LLTALHCWWTEQAGQRGARGAASLLASELWEFLHDSTPTRRRQRYGDMEYDWEHRVNTTSGTVGWRERLLGTFHSAYQPTDPSSFAEMIASLPIDFREFTFVDLGSGKGRTLLMAAEYPFRRIVGIELLPALHQIAQENLARYSSESQRCFALEALCGDAGDFCFPAEPLVLYLFNPFPESGLKRVMAALERSLSAYSRTVYVLYLNPALEHVLARSTALERTGGTHQFAIYTNVR